MRMHYISCLTIVLLDDLYAKPIVAATIFAGFYIVLLPYTNRVSE